MAKEKPHVQAIEKVDALQMGIAGSRDSEGHVMYEFSMRVRVDSVMIVAKSIQEGVYKVAFVTAATPTKALARLRSHMYEDGFDWRLDKYRT